MIRRVVSLLVVNLVVFAVAAELIALAVFYYQTGWLYYIDPYRPQLAAVPEPPAGALTTAALHPYFGPTHQPGIPFDMPEALRDPAAPPEASRPATNNFGFTARRDYPVARASDRQLLVGIFGGSVGAWFCEAGAARLAARLAAAPAFRGRDVVPLCFSHEGYKQPQQLLVLSYFLSIGQAFDLVINIDGFNEVAISPLNTARGTDLSMPSVIHMDPLTALLDQSSMSAGKVEALARIHGYRQRLNAVAARANGAWSAAWHVALTRMHGVLDRQYRAEVARFDALPTSGPSLVRVTPPVRARAGAELYRDIASQWARSSVLMHQMLAGRGARYVHVLQPNQYFTTRPFAPGEAAVALAADSLFKPGVEQGYPALQRADRLGRSGHRGRHRRRRRPPVRRGAGAGVHRQLLPLHQARLRDPGRRDRRGRGRDRAVDRPPWRHLSPARTTPAPRRGAAGPPCRTRGCRSPGNPCRCA